MLIIPIQDKPDWSRPPLVTLSLILLNILVFVFYQGRDPEIAEQAVTLYQEHQLLEVERPYYVRYLEAEAPERLTLWQELDEQQQWLGWPIVYDREFDAYLRKLWETESFPDDIDLAQWQAQRLEFEQQRNRLSSVQSGLTPAEAKPLTFLTSQFLHGGWGHLLGNMAFLFLFGFTLETVLGAWRYLLMYLTAGLAANALHLGLHPHSMTPLVGASGAISGLMGMYLALYRLRRIRFFYSVIFYFGELRAPALVVLPLWLAKELYGHFFVDSNTAYWAHIGGLLAGATMLLAAQKSRRQFAQQLDDNEGRDQVARVLKQAELAMAQLEFDRARMLARKLCQDYPGDPRPWHLLFDLHKIRPKQKPFHEETFKFLKQFVRADSDFSRWQPHLAEVLAEYQQLAPGTPAITGPLSLAMAAKLWRNGDWQSAEHYLERALEKGANPEKSARLLTRMIAQYQQRQQQERAERLARWLNQLA